MGDSQTYVAKQPRVRPRGRSGDGVELGVEDPPDLRWWSRRRGAWASADGGRGSPAEMAVGGKTRPGHLGEAAGGQVLSPAPRPFTKPPPRHFLGSPPRLAGPPPGWVRSLPPWDIFTERSSNCI